mgnify:CR=1 FL=1
MNHAAAATTPTRRRFLNILLGGSLAAWAASIFYPVIRFLKPLPQSGPSGPTRLTRAEVGKLESAGFVIVPMGSKRAIVFQDAQSKVRALSAKCTHEGCTVQYSAGESVIWCACHNGRFDLDGRVLAGPPPRPLVPFKVQRDNDGNISIAPEQA